MAEQIPLGSTTPEATGAPAESSGSSESLAVAQVAPEISETAARPPRPVSAPPRIRSSLPPRPSTVPPLGEPPSTPTPLLGHTSFGEDAAHAPHEAHAHELSKEHAVAILAMRIIRIDRPDGEQPLVSDILDSDADAVDADEADIEITTETNETLEEVVEVEVSPDSDAEPQVRASDVGDSDIRDSGLDLDRPSDVMLPLGASAEDLSAEVEAEDSSLEDGSRPSPPSRRQPPPRKRRLSTPPPAPPSASAVEKALKPTRFDPTTRKRGRVWWEDLFNEDFGRALLPINDDQVRLEADFIEHALGVVKSGLILDLACGTGQHAVDLSGRGYNVVGYDLSVSQLAEASELAQDRNLKINFLQGDMRDMAFDGMFDGVYCWNTSFGYFEEEKNVQVAKHVFRSLKSGGSFLLDVINRDFAVAQQPVQNWFEGDACVCMDDMSVDFITSRLRVKRTIMLDDGRTRESAYSIRIYGLHELGKLLHDIGFKVIQASGQVALPGVFFGAQSPRIIILASKP